MENDGLHSDLCCTRKLENKILHSDVCRKRKPENRTHGSSCWYRKSVIDEQRSSSVDEKLGKQLRFWYLSNKKWRGFADEITAAIRFPFTAHQKRVKFSISDQLYVIDFPHMLQLNIKTGYIRSIAWVDCSGKFVTPEKCVEGHSRHWLSLLRHKTQMASSAFVKEDSASFQQTLSPHRKSGSFQCRDYLAGMEPCSDVSMELGNSGSLVESKDQAYSLVKDKFITGLGSFAEYMSVLAIHRCLFEGKSAVKRLETFQKQIQAVKPVKGNENICYAWHGSSKEEILGIVSQGFQRPQLQSEGAEYGSDVCLAPERNAFLGAMWSDSDEQGVHYILLCKVILGKMEQTPKDLEQFFLSSNDRDTLVDDFRHPSQYVVCSTRVNTHILPEFVVSFKPSACCKSLFLAMKTRSYSSVRCCLPCKQFQFQTSTRHHGTDLRDSSKLEIGAHDSFPPARLRMESQSPGITFQHLLLMMKQTVDPCSFLILQKLHTEFQVMPCYWNVLSENRRVRMANLVQNQMRRKAYICLRGNRNACRYTFLLL
ncbi:hypothetical protein KP509_15G016500 [Ceratopteris richardii]|uniref:Poly [ADP-ribose] polymerase n=1 Tax=Ceratopteris richardii TaxID=49495 RepID=A0A8T2T2Z7_CERRI|nr:hypothetical protein KP509_15G016500 [Ceratopteris richardii]